MNNNNPIFDNDDIDWDEIDMDMLSDRDDAIEDYIDDKYLICKNEKKIHYIQEF